jgi:calcium binding protein 39
LQARVEGSEAADLSRLSPPPPPVSPPASFTTLSNLYSSILATDNYVLKRQSLKLLSEFLLDRDNFKIMMRYISDKKNLKAIMLILRSPAANIQFEAFHVFKVFVANPNKPADIAEILRLNKARLVTFLQGFQ